MLPDHVEYDADCYRRIHDLLLPYGSEDIQKVTEIKEMIRALCKNAYSLVLTFRLSKSKWEIVHPEKKEVLGSNPPGVEVQHMLPESEDDNNDSVEGAHVVCTLWGGLKKSSEYRSELTITMVPAMIVAKR